MVEGPDPKLIARHELLGLKVNVRMKVGKDVRSFTGTVINETRNMVEIEGEGKRWKLPKMLCTFTFFLPSNQKVHVEGWRLIGRPEERLKKKGRRW